MQTKRKYDRSFKERAIQLNYEHNSITELVKELDILPNRIYS